MKTILFILISFLSRHQTDTTGLYDIQFLRIDSGVVNMQTYAGKPLIIIEFNAANPDRTQLQYFDSVFKNNNQINIIAIPLQDFEGSLSRDSLRSLLVDTFGISYTIADVALGQKQAGDSQHPLMKWLTNVDQNLHFNTDITVEGETFIISSDGVLYSEIMRDADPDNSLLTYILNNP